MILIVFSQIHEGGRNRKIERTAQWRESQLVLVAKRYFGDHVKEIVMGGVCTELK